MTLIRLGDYARCRTGDVDVVMSGDAGYVICGLPVAREGDSMLHGGKIAKGSSGLLANGPTFELPANAAIQGPSEYTSKVIRDMYFLSTTKTGKEILGRMAAAAPKTVTILPEPLPISSSAGKNERDEVVILYSPEIAINVQNERGEWMPCEPQIVLGHELIHALHDLEGTSYPKGSRDPRPPASEPEIEREEAATIGVGSHRDDFPTENALREDLGLPRRGNHLALPSDPLLAMALISLSSALKIQLNIEAIPEPIRKQLGTMQFKPPVKDLRPGPCPQRRMPTYE